MSGEIHAMKVISRNLTSDDLLYYKYTPLTSASVDVESKIEK